MSRPTIDGLRQAFLDHESRIRFGPDRPEDLLTHPRIARIQISGLDFMEDVDLALSPNMTTLIGGGGTGKSTVLEAIRATTGFPPTTGDESRRLHERARSGFATGRVVLTCQQGNELVELVLDRGARADATSFPITAFSQREAFAIADSPPATQAFLDNLRRDDTAELDRKEAGVRSRLRRLDDDLDGLGQAERWRSDAAADIARLEAVLAAAEARAEPLAARNRHRREMSVVAAVDDRLGVLADLLDETAADVSLGVSTSELEVPSPTPNAAGVTAFVDRARTEVEAAAEAVSTAIARLRGFAAAESGSQERSAWEAHLSDAETAYAAAKAATTEDPTEIGNRLAQRRATLAAAEAEVRELQARAAQRPALQNELEVIWRAQADLRTTIATELGAVVPKTSAGTPYVTVEVEAFADIEPLVAQLCEWVDRRRLSDDDSKLFCQAVVAHPAAGSGGLLADAIDHLEGGGDPPIKLSGSAVQTLVEKVTPRQRSRLRTLRPLDTSTVVLHRKDGTRAGTLTQGLSVGQRCTAILALALATGTEPIVIDQPEDEIDNEFIFAELVPLLRSAKERRQVIVASHNPNIPVNGDAELIVALSATSDGAQRAHGKVTAAGSLDQAAVREKVELIMEGSKDAFERRRSRYGF